MAVKDTQYKWRKNLACVATYNILEGDNFLDQFEDTDIAFAKAGDIKLGKLRYFPKTTGNQNIIEMIAMEVARKFLTYVVKTYTVTKEYPQKKSGDIIQALAKVFGDGAKTISELAEIVDENIKFPDET